MIERTMSRLSGYRRLSPRYERHPRNYLGLPGLAAAPRSYADALLDGREITPRLSYCP
ncbi:hypothetical protein AB0D24_44560 [Streptomyces javensis]